MTLNPITGDVFKVTEIENANEWKGAFLRTFNYNSKQWELRFDSYIGFNTFFNFKPTGNPECDCLIEYLNNICMYQKRR